MEAFPMPEAFLRSLSLYLKNHSIKLSGIYLPGKKQGHRSGFQESRLQSVQRFAWKNPTGYGSREKRGSQRARWYSSIPSDKLKSLVPTKVMRFILSKSIERKSVSDQFKKEDIGLYIIRITYLWQIQNGPSLISKYYWLHFITHLQITGFP